MCNSFIGFGRAVLTAVALAVTVPSLAADIGRVKVAKGQVTIEREGSSQPAVVGMRVQASDTLRTGSDGSLGITMDDDSLLSTGPKRDETIRRAGTPLDGWLA